MHCSHLWMPSTTAISNPPSPGACSDDEREGPYVELDLACGLFDLKDEAAVSAAERSLVAGGAAVERDSDSDVESSSGSETSSGEEEKEGQKNGEQDQQQQREGSSLAVRQQQQEQQQRRPQRGKRPRRRPKIEELP